MAVDKQELKEQLQKDKRHAADLRTAAGEAAKRPEYDSTPNIVGTNFESPAYRAWQSGEQKALRSIRQNLFFKRIDTIRRQGDDEEEITFLVTKARQSPPLDSDEWQIVAWTSPITAQLLDAERGDTVEHKAPGRPAVSFSVCGSASFEQVFPSIRKAHYRLGSGVVFIEDEADLAEQLDALPAEPPQQEYSALRTFGLSEIIYLVDTPQRSAMHLPFFKDVLIEGPPGSGKTSIGIMRIPCLLDRQYDELDLARDQPFHTVQSMRVLVLNDEMVDYLDTLTRSLGIDGIQVQTLGEFARQICTAAGSLRGRQTEESPDLVPLKVHPLVLDAYWAGFARNAASVLERTADEWRGRLSSADPAATLVLDRLSSWVAALSHADLLEGRLPHSVNLAERALAWTQEAVQSAVAGVHDADAEERIRKSVAAEAGTVLRDAWKRMIDWVAVSRAMFETAAFAALLNEVDPAPGGESGQASAAAEWRSRLAEDAPKFTEYDAALAAWLGAHVALVGSSSAKPMVGGQLDHLTHVLIDEAQDAWLAHVATVRRTVADGGTVTLVGDLRQRLKHRGLGTWSELGTGGFLSAAFRYNYRQSYELGLFVGRLHESLFDDAPTWEPSTKRNGPMPVVRAAKLGQLATVTAAEIKRWREETPRATVGVLYDSSWRSADLERFADQLESELQDTLTPVHSVDAAGVAHIRRTDCVIVAPVVYTKGLEFDAVVFVETDGAWTQPLESLSGRLRSGLYVAASRSRHGLSMLFSCIPSFIASMGEEGVCRLET